MSIDLVEGIQIENPKVTRVEEHLKKIDPVLTPFARRLSLPPYKDLSSSREFANGELRLDAGNLVAVHLTDTFPEDGVIRPRVFYEPDLLRFTSHFAINSIPEAVAETGDEWADKKFAILVPVRNMLPRIEEFNLNDTFVLEELKLPDGSVVMMDQDNRSWHASAGTADVVTTDYSKKGERLSGFQRAVYEQMINMGYFPQRATTSQEGGWYTWDITQERDILRDFCRRYNLKLGIGRHAAHWSSYIEGISEWLGEIQASGDESGFQDALEEINYRFFDPKSALYEEGVPDKYKNALLQQAYSYRDKFFPTVEISKLRASLTEHLDENTKVA